MAVAAGLGVVALTSQTLALAAPAGYDGPILNRPIPSTGERLPAIGLGTGFTFGRNGPNAETVQVVRTLVAGGGSVIDTASLYGPAETVLGTIFGDTGLRPQIFIATKLEPEELPGADPWKAKVQSTAKALVDKYFPALTHPGLQGSLRRLRTDHIDLLQVHSVSEPQQSLAALREWKAQNLIRYTGITTSDPSDFAAVEAVLRREKPDFLQVDYSLDDREVENRLLPAAKELGIAVLINMPFGEGKLFRAVRGKPLPDWAGDFGATSWAQFFLKYILANPTVTAVIPGTSNAQHMADNLAAGHGPMPDNAMRQRMLQLVQSFGTG